ncbi:MAG TPA: isocitrate lyase/phosphoenolpyruvate mutase family protein [Pyrinomonadaceae bacterium]|jgi:2-methylisocitrate lyase-like PEP mutase family enzyme|nr:isocitrate lyase/phosphoenolpyruvate mutase family protein [Pyrinomonadaceae bacterium]
MANQIERAKSFAQLHIKGDPLILFNAWDAGTAKAAQEIGSKAIATGSYAVALANGFEDGEKVPMEFVLANLTRIVASVDIPVTLDFEGGYSREQDKLAENVTEVIRAGAIGINFEDRIVAGEGLYCIEEQAARISAMRDAADASGIPLFINARCDVVLSLDTSTHNESHLEQMIERAAAYAEAGASGFFAPGLVNPDFIGRLVDASPIPVNILVWPGVPSSRTLADLGVARISYGGGAYRTTMEAFKTAGRNAVEWKTLAEKAAK